MSEKSSSTRKSANFNDNWKDSSDQQEMTATSIAPSEHFVTVFENKSKEDQQNNTASSVSSVKSEFYESAVCFPLFEDEVKVLDESLVEDTSVRESVVLYNSRLTLKRSNMFYGQRVVWPKKDDQLLAAILSHDVGGREITDTRLQEVKTRLEPLVHQVLLALSKAKCPKSPQFDEKDSDVVDLLELYQPTWRVYMWLRYVIRSAIPIELVGSTENRQHFLRCVRNLIYRGRFDRLSLGEVMTGFKVTVCKWMPRKMIITNKEALVAKVMAFILEKIAIGLVSRYFYVTEDSIHRSRVFYYNKNVWRRIQLLGVAELRASEFVVPIDLDEVRKRLDKGHLLGVAKLRFLPKHSGIRPIVNMSSKANSGPHKGSSINQLMKNILSVLVYEKNQRPELVGSTVWNRGDVYQKWKQFVLDRKQRQDTRTLYFVKIDIRRCFEMIDASKVVSLIEAEVLREGQYLIQKHVRVYRTQGQVKRVFVKEAMALREYEPNFDRYARKRIREGKLHDAIFIDQVHHVMLSKQQIMDRLRCHLFNNVLVQDKTYLHQVCGIPQGSVLSTFLCNLYYGKMEKTCLSFLPAPSTVDSASEDSALSRDLVSVIDLDSDTLLHTSATSSESVAQKNSSSSVNITDITEEKLVQSQSDTALQNRKRKQTDNFESQQELKRLRTSASEEKFDNAMVWDSNCEKLIATEESFKSVAFKPEETKSGCGVSYLLEGEVMMRQVDDFMFVTPYQDRASEFLARMNEGFPEYNSYINKSKTVVNFEAGEAKVIPPGAFMPWLGLLFDPVTLGVTFDLSRLHGLEPEDMFTLDNSNQPGATLRLKIIRLVCCKLNLIVLDPVVNTESMLFTSLYKLFYTTAVRLEAYMRKLPQLNVCFILKLILELPNILWSKVNGWLDCKWLPLAIIKWLCLEAFRSRLVRHKAEWFLLIQALKKELVKAAGKKQLKAVVVEQLKSLIAGVEGELADL